MNKKIFLLAIVLCIVIPNFIDAFSSSTITAARHLLRGSNGKFVTKADFFREQIMSSGVVKLKDVAIPSVFENVAFKNTFLGAGVQEQVEKCLLDAQQSLLGQKATKTVLDSSFIGLNQKSLINVAQQSKNFINSNASKCYQRLHGLLVDSFEITRDEIHKSCIKNGIVNEAAKRWREEAILNYKFVGTGLKTGIIADMGFHPESLEHMRTYMNFDFAEQLVVYPVDKVAQLSGDIRHSAAVIGNIAESSSSVAVIGNIAESSSSVVASSQQGIVKPLNLMESVFKAASDNPMAVGILVATTTVLGYCAYYRINPVKKIKNMVNQVKNQLPVSVKA